MTTKSRETAAEVVAFPDTNCTENCQPIIVKILEDCAGTDESCDITDILICRELTPEEEKRLGEAKTREEAEDLVNLIKNINEPIEYEIDLRTR